MSFQLKKIISKLFSNPNPAFNNLGSGKSFEEKYNELGVFQYDTNGFFIKYENFYKRLEWHEITQLNVYKRDLITIDRVEMEIVYGDKSITISEDLPGWWQFTLKIQAVYPAIPEDWFSVVDQPPFATNWTTIYEKTDRNS